MREIFVDCGANLGVVLKDFITKMPSYEFYAFEPNRDLIPSIRQNVDATGHKAVQVINAGVWTHDGEIDFFLGGHESSTIMLGKEMRHANGKPVDYNAPRKISCIDFSRWLTKNFSPKDNIIVKMDIEGAEYPVLRKMIEDNSLKFIKTLYVEWHYDRFNYISKEQHEALMNEVAIRTELKPWH